MYYYWDGVSSPRVRVSSFVSNNHQMNLRAKILGTMKFININNKDDDFDFDPFILTEHSFFLENELYNDHAFVRYIGDIRFKTMVGPYAYAFSKLEFAHTEGLSVHQNLQKVSSELFDRLEDFINFLWFIRDTCAFIEEFICYMPGESIMITASKNYIAKSTGELSPTTFTLAELSRAHDILSQYYLLVDNGTRSTIPVSLPDEYGITKSGLTLFPYNLRHRIERTVIFLALARKQSFLPLRIALLVPIYECLFSYETGEISHKVGERTANYVGGDREEKVRIYKLVKAAYDVRSSVLHGSKLSSSQKYLGASISDPQAQINLSTDLESLTRNVLTQAIMKDSNRFIDRDKNEADYKQFLAELMFQ